MGEQAMNRRYLDIYEEIKRGILDGKYPPGDKLPSENDFCELFGTSRGTVRRALDMLADEGLVTSLHGKGVYVLDSNLITFSFGGLVSFKEAMASSGEQFSTSVPRFGEIVIDESLSQKTQLPAGQSAYEIYRVRELDGEKVILDVNYFLKDAVTGLAISHAEQSIYEYIEQSLKLKIGFAKRLIHVEQATGRDKEFLSLKSYNFVAVVKNYVYLHDGTQFEYTESRHRPDRFEFSDFARRR